MIFVALVAETLFSAGPVLSGGSLATFGESYWVAQMPSWSTTSCGLSLLTSCDGQSFQRSTLGGLLAVNGAIVGLTAGHPFDRTNRSPAAERSAQGDPAADNASSEISSIISSEPFIFNGDEDDDADGEDVNNDSVMIRPLQNANGYLDSDNQTPYQSAEASILQEPLRWHASPSQATVLPVSGVGDDEWDDGSQNDRDWALLLGLPLAVRSQPNKVAHKDPRDDYQITVTSSGPAAGEVVVATASIGPQIGQLHSAPAAMKVDQLVLNVQLITLEHVLPRGSSGAWVVLEEKLCGYVVAIRQDLPWAYMVAIEPVIEDIKRTLKSGDVRIPTAREIELAAQAYSNDPSYLWSSEADKQSQLQDKDWPLASTMQGCDRLDWRPELNSTSEMQGGHKLPSHEDVKDIPKGAEGNSTKGVSKRPNQLGPVELGPSEDSILPDNPWIPALDEHKCRRPQEAKDSRHKRQGFVKPEQAHSKRDSSQAAAAVPIEIFSPTPCNTPVPSALPSPNCSPESMTELPDPQEISIGQVRGTRKGKSSDSSNLVSFTLPSSNKFLPYPSERSEYISERDEEKTSPNSRGFVNGPWGNEETVSPFNIWWGFEAFILRLEYRRWNYAPYGGLFSFRGLLLNPLRSPGRTPLWIALSSCVTFLYFLCFFAFICWVWKRYGDVLATDSSKADPLNSRRRRAIRMLGTLPDQYRDAELVKERERLRQTGFFCKSSAV
ncbi:MAG: hypothetical protein Q9203_006574 [Teloschistes exilis]